MALLPIPAWGQQAPASPRRDVAEMSLEDNRVRFEVGVTAAEEAGLQVSSGREH